ncbi:hypothetical protein [Psychromonas hadalis]|uniref:hypothetical protein n=1 Tax=Psychromonas hadalis TaxID=211669 RepID=UPI0003B3793D|nr:hypothetical protein [Psychromonas hadalis]
MHFCFSITAHGFGHGAISCSVINRLMKYHPHIKISVMTRLPKSYLDSRLIAEFDYHSIGFDFGMLMASPIVVDVQNSRDKYQALFENWQSFVDQEKQLLIEIKPDRMISNISPISLDAALQLGIKTASVAPFNWAQIYQRYCLDESQQTQSVYQKMNAVYQAVDQVFKPLPFVPLDDGSEIILASINDQPQVDLVCLLKLLPENTKKIGLIALGGLPFPLDLTRWPKIEGLHWLVDQTILTARSDMSQIGLLNMPFLQLVASADLIITKPGYGTYCEIASLAKHKKIRTISLERPDWPETPYLNHFLSERVPFVEIDALQLSTEALKTVIENLSQLDYPNELLCEDGAMQLIKFLLRY